MNMKKGTIPLLATGILFCGACVSPYLTNRFHDAAFVERKAAGDLLKVSAFVLDVPPPAAKNFIFELSPEAQSALVQVLADKTETVEAFMDSLKNGGGEGADGGDCMDKSRFRKRIVFSVEKKMSADPGEIGPADRVSELLVKLAIPERARFLSWNRFETKFESVELGKVNATQNSKAGLAGTMLPKSPLLPATIPVTAEFARNLAEEVSLKQRYVSISGSLDFQNARLYQQGGVGIDLAGNFFVDLDVRSATDPTRDETFITIGNLKSKAGYTAAEKLQVEFKKLRFASSSTPVRCALDFDFILRHVANKGHTVIEGDDGVQFVLGSGRNEFELLGMTDLKARVFKIISHRLNNGKPSPDSFILHLTGCREAPICFASYGMARGFLEWLKETKSTRIGQCALVLDDKPLDGRDIQGLEIEVIDLN
jgi:hypothetical protein